MMALGLHCVDELRFMLRQEVTEIAAITDRQNDPQPLENLATLLSQIFWWHYRHRNLRIPYARVPKFGVPIRQRRQDNLQ